ncbi:restriction endonuclease subunit S, partial [Gammaproteobacteria bacterium]|nr:restriction endonuclease subunit S [Gammaproteobacteria bacterium]
MWTTNLLSSVVNISPGNSIPAKKKSELFTGVKGMPYVATKDISFAGIINYYNGICIPENYLNNFRISSKGATLICAEGGSAGRKIAFSPDECCYVNKLFSLQPTNKIIPKFL